MNNTPVPSAAIDVDAVTVLCQIHATAVYPDAAIRDAVLRSVALLALEGDFAKLRKILAALEHKRPKLYKRQTTCTASLN